VGSERLSVGRVQLLLEALFLEQGVNVPGTVGKAALQWIADWLHLDPWTHFGSQTLAHLVAIQIAPRDAIKYAPVNPTPRWRLIDGYLGACSPIAADEREAIARVVASVLDAADLPRGRELVPADIADACAICRLPFRREARSVITRDPYKPIWLAPTELSRAEVDHIVPISSIGSHTEANLQVVCRACNLAKGAGLTIEPSTEIRYAAEGLADVPRIHLFRLLQWLIKTRGDECHRCGAVDGELTMRPLFPAAPLARAVMAVRCYECVGQEGRQGS
jgi:hypothetical protein